MKKGFIVLLIGLAGFLVVAGLILLEAWAVMLLWNWIMPLFGVCILNIWQVIGLEALITLLFRLKFNFQSLQLKNLINKKLSHEDSLV